MAELPKKDGPAAEAAPKAPEPPKRNPAFRAMGRFPHVGCTASALTMYRPSELQMEASFEELDDFPDHYQLLDGGYHV